MDAARAFIALALTLSVPPMLLFWLLLHPWVGLWRRLGVVYSYALILSVLLASVILIFRRREVLVAFDLGTNAALAVLGCCLLLAAGVVRRLLARTTTGALLSGLPELDPDEHGTPLVTAGLHAHVRHPRYLQGLLALVGWSLVANHGSVHLLVAGTALLLLVIIRLEERELHARFGEEYARYCSRVPRLIPRIRPG